MQMKKKTNLRPGKGAKKLWVQLRRSLMALVIMASTTMACFATEDEAGGFAETKAGGGTIALVHDFTLYFTYLGPLVCVLVAIYSAMRARLANEDTDGAKWKKKIVDALEWAVGIGLISGFITWVIGHYV